MAFLQNWQLVLSAEHVGLSDDVALAAVQKYAVVLCVTDVGVSFYHPSVCGIVSLGDGIRLN